MTIYEFEGVRTYRRSHASAMVAKRICIWFGAGCRTVAELAKELRGDRSLGAAYLGVQRAFPFEDAQLGLVYSLKGVDVICKKGRLEDVEPPKRSAIGRESIAALVKAEVAKLETFVNIYALREEARKLLEGVEERVMKKVADEVKKELVRLKILVDNSDDIG